MRNGKIHVRPFRYVVSAPMPSPLTTARESGTGDDKRSLSRKDVQQSMVSSFCFLVAPEVMHIVLQYAISMSGVRRDGLNSEIMTMLYMVDNVRRVVDIAYPRSRFCP